MADPKTTEPRAYTAEEVREQFLGQMRALAHYWSGVGGTEREMLDGLCFSILNIFDGTSMALPAMDLVLRPHADDMEFHKAEGDNWYEPGQVINDTMMHEEFYK